MYPNVQPNKGGRKMAQKRKRAPGAGRKPQGEFSGKTAKLTMRITPATRKELETFAKKSGLSLSQAAEHHLSLSLSKVRIRDHIQALGEAVMLLAQRIESKTEKTGKLHWNEDVFTGEALRRGIEVLVSHFAPRGTPVTPISVKEAAAEMVGDAGEAYRSPVGLGETEAAQVMAWIEISNFRDLQEIESAHAELRKSIPGVRFPKKKWPLHKQIFDELKPGGNPAREK
jgi:hypothetical protein